MSTPNTLSKKNSFTNMDSAANTAYSSNATGYSSNKQIGSGYDKGGVNVLRMSQNIMKNRIKESNQSGYENKENKDVIDNDVKLLNKDQELNFGDGDDEEEDEENADSSSADNNQDEGVEEEEQKQVDTAAVTKIDFNKKMASKSPRAATPSNKTIQTVKTNTRNMKPENDVSEIFFD